jgi:hypothetical protein
MSEMVERVARSIFGSMFTVFEEWLDETGGFDPSRLGPITAQRWFDCQDAARAAIAAMREPTKEILFALQDRPDLAAGTVLPDLWRAMIGELLKE